VAYDHHESTTPPGPDEGKKIENPLGGVVTIKLRGAQATGTVAAFDTVLEAFGEGPPLHLHEGYDEIVLVLSGSFRFKLGDRVADAPSGSFVFIPRGLEHTWQKVGDEPGRLFIVVAPAGFESFFERFAEESPDEGWAEVFARAGATVGMRVVGPPLPRSLQQR
jgi:quercetin dioxygenase-like cupin family protein